MQLQLRPHATKRMRQRRISEEDIKSALRNYQSKTETPENSYRFEGPDTQGRTIKVWCNKSMAGPGRFMINSVARKGE